MAKLLRINGDYVHITADAPGVSSVPSTGAVGRKQDANMTGKVVNFLYMGLFQGFPKTKGKRC